MGEFQKVKVQCSLSQIFKKKKKPLYRYPYICIHMCEMEKLRKLNVNKSLGPDGIHLRFKKDTEQKKKTQSRITIKVCIDCH